MPFVSVLRRLLPAAAVAAVLALTAAAPAHADRAGERWAASFWPQARAAGVSAATYQRALGTFTPDPDVLARAGNQAEFVRPIWDYLDSVVSEQRIATGRDILRRYGPQLAAIEAAYGVDRQVLVAIWGMESSYGAILANPKIVKNVVRSLATLAYAGGSRAGYGRQQLIAALKILDRGDIGADGMTGSWAGAMGHTQFIPTTYEAYAVDFDRDGRRDIWNSPIDALASAANYLHKSGWVKGHAWGYEVALPRGFDYRLADGVTRRSLAEWARLGVGRVDGQAFPRSEDAASLILPAGANGPVFLVLGNFKAIKHYNNADAYALAVGHLADCLEGHGPFGRPWPVEDKPLNRGQMRELQQHLAKRGFYRGEIDAKLGAGARAAVRAYQASAGLIPDGYASLLLLERLRRGG